MFGIILSYYWFPVKNNLARLKLRHKPLPLWVVVIRDPIGALSWGFVKVRYSIGKVLKGLDF